MDYTQLTIESKRLILVPISMDYIDQIYIYFDEVVTQYMFPAPAKELKDTCMFISSSQEKLKAGTDYTFVILRKDNSEFLGCGGVHNLQNESPEFGIWTKTSAHGFRYGFEAVEAAYNHFKKQYTSFIYPVDKDNIPSKKIALGLGGKLNKTYPHESQSGKVLNIEEYLIFSARK